MIPVTVRFREGTRTGLLVLVGILLCGVASASEYQPCQVLTLHGEVRMFAVPDTAWRPVRSGQVLPSHALVDLAAGAVLECNTAALAAGKSSVGKSSVGKNAAIHRVKGPAFLRLGDNVRTMEFDDYVLKAIPRGASKDPPVKPALSLSEAWRRLMAMLINPESKTKLPKKTPKDPGEEPVTTMTPVGEITLFEPAFDLVLTGTAFPFETEAVWLSAEEHVKPYRLWLWPTDEIKGAPLDEVYGDRYVLALMPGSYRFQVTTRDQMYRSRVRTLRVTAPSRAGEGHTPLAEGQEVVRTLPWKEQLPPQGMVMAAADASPVRFSWALPDAITDRRGDYEFRLYQKGNSEARFVRTLSGTMLSLPVLGGVWEWQVLLRRPDGSSVASEVNILEVTGTEPGPDKLRSLIQRAGDDGVPARIMVH